MKFDAVSRNEKGVKSKARVLFALAVLARARDTRSDIAAIIRHSVAPDVAADCPAMEVLNAPSWHGNSSPISPCIAEKPAHFQQVSRRYPQLHRSTTLHRDAMNKMRRTAAFSMQ